MNISIDGKNVRIVANAGDTENEIGVVIDLPEDKADEVWRAIRNACWMIRNPAKTVTIDLRDDGPEGRVGLAGVTGVIDRAAFDSAA